MALTIAGDVEHERIFDIADSFSPQISPVPRYVLASAEEPSGIFETEASEQMTVSLPLFDIGFKESAYSRFSEIKNDLLMDMILDLTAGESTEFFRSMYEQNLINDSFGSGFYSGDEYLCTYFEGDSLYPGKVRDFLLERISELKRTGFDPELFDERVRTSVGSYISIFDNPGSVAGSLMSCHFKKTTLYDIIQLVGDPDIEEANELLRACFDPGSCCLSVVLPNSSGEKQQ